MFDSAINEPAFDINRKHAFFNIPGFDVLNGTIKPNTTNSTHQLWYVLSMEMDLYILRAKEKEKAMNGFKISEF